MRIFNRYYSRYDSLLVLGDIAITFLASGAVRFIMVFAGFSANAYWLFWSLQGVIMSLTVATSFYYTDLYSIDQTLSVRELLLRFMNGFGIACILIGLISYPIPELGFRAIYFSEMAFMGISLCIWRVGFMRIIAVAGNSAKVLIVGVQTIGKLVAEQLCQQKRLGMEVVGFIGSSTGEIALRYGNPRQVILPVFQPRSVSQVIKDLGVSRILLAGADAFGDGLAKELVMLRASGVPIEDCHSFYERLVSKIAITDLSPEWITLSKGFRRDRIILAAKRVIDLVVSSVGLVLSAPLALLTAIAIKVDSPGSVLYRQERVGQNDACFNLYKFRSMAEDAEAGAGPVWASENDPRATRVGRIIRKLRIDEIPQMVNVLRGEMSFVGPRPERPFFVKTLEAKIPYYYLRHSVKPGITGWAQISYSYGDSDADAIEKLQYDLYYIKNMSPIFDLQIIFESFKVIILGKGAR